MMSCGLTASGALVYMVTVADVRSAFLRLNLRNVTSPSCVRTCENLLAEEFTGIVNVSLLHFEVPPAFK